MSGMQITRNDSDVETMAGNTVVVAGEIANEYAAQYVFLDYQSRKSPGTLRRQRAGLQLFATFLATAGVRDAPSGDMLITAPRAWEGVSWGIVEAFRSWMLSKGYAIGSINVQISTIKMYAKLASKAGVLNPEVFSMIRMVDGYSRSEGKKVNDRRKQTRIGAKKAKPVHITPIHAHQLKQQPNTPQGRRDAVLMALLLDHGLRVSEVAGLQVTDIDLAAGTVTFYRIKVDLTQTHRLSADALRSLRAYFDCGDALAGSALLRASAGPYRLTHAGVSKRNLSERVRTLGALIGIDGLSAHDLRHYWATQAARSGTPFDKLKSAGGWKSAEGAMTYIRNATVANEGVILA